MAAVVDAKAGQSRLLPDTAPEFVEPRRREFVGKHALCAVRVRQRRDQLRRFRPELDRARPGLGVLDARARAILGQGADLVPSQVDDFGEPGPGQGQQSQRRDLPGAIPGVPVQHRAKPRKLVLVEIASDGLLRIDRDVGAGVGDVFADLTPLPRGLEHGAQDVERPVGRAGPLRARRVEPRGDPRMVDGVELEPPLHVDVEGLER